MTPPTLEVLLARVYRHYPRGIESGDPRHHDSEESRRLACVHEAAAMACGKEYAPVPDDERVAIDAEVASVVDALRAWASFGQRICAAFPGVEVWDESGPFFDPGHRYSVADAEYAHPSESWRDPVVCAVSVLAPVYVLYTYVPMTDGVTKVCYAGFPARYQDRIARLSKLAEDSFGFHRLDEETVLTIVPDVAPFGANRAIGQITLMDCLFSSHP